MAKSSKSVAKTKASSRSSRAVTSRAKSAKPLRTRTTQSAARAKTNSKTNSKTSSKAIAPKARLKAGQKAVGSVRSGREKSPLAAKAVPTKARRERLASKTTLAPEKAAVARGETKAVTVRPVRPEPPKPPPPQPKPKPKKSPFDKRQLEVIRKQLDEMAAELRKELEEIEEAAFNVSQSEMSGEVSYDEDSADSGSFTFEREKDLSIANNVQDLLDKIARSTDKIDEGTYGICEVCGNAIEPARLKALPHALLCVRDKALEERR